MRISDWSSDVCSSDLSLGMNANKLKAAAAEFMADRMKGQDTLGEIEALKAEIERLKARSTVPPVQDSTPEEIEAALQAADDAYDALSDEELKQTIADRFGSRPKGNPGRDTLLNKIGRAHV